MIDTLTVGITFEDYRKITNEGLFIKVSLSESGTFKVDRINHIRKETSKTSDAAKSVDVDKRGS